MASIPNRVANFACVFPSYKTVVYPNSSCMSFKLKRCSVIGILSGTPPAKAIKKRSLDVILI